MKLGKMNHCSIQEGVKISCLLMYSYVNYVKFSKTHIHTRNNLALLLIPYSLIILPFVYCMYCPFVNLDFESYHYGLQVL